MNRRKGLLVGGVCLLVLIGTLAGLWISAARRFVDPMRDLLAIPRFERAAWMPEDPAADFERLVNVVTRKRVWSDEDARFVLSAMQRERVNESPPPGVHEIPHSILKATPQEIEAFLKRPDAMEIAEWNIAFFLRSTAWNTVQERLLRGLDVPEPTRSFAVESWLGWLDDSDKEIRSEGAMSLINSGLIADQTIRMRLEAVRLGDPSADVRAAVDRKLQHYDRVHHGIEPSGPTSDCNTCP
jgi:hypothetical protein